MPAKTGGAPTTPASDFAASAPIHRDGLRAK